MVFYVSKETIGKVDFEDSSWFTGYNEKFFYGKGAFCAQKSSHFSILWCYYYLFRYKTKKGISNKDRLLWMKRGVNGYREMKGYLEKQGSSLL